MTPPSRRAVGLRVTHCLERAGAELVELDVLAREAGLRRAAASRFVALGLVEPLGGSAERPLFDRTDAAMLASAARLRRDLGLNYAGAVLACELLARVERLEQRLEAAGELDRSEGRPRS